MLFVVVLLRFRPFGNDQVDYEARIATAKTEAQKATYRKMAAKQVNNGIQASASQSYVDSTLALPNFVTASHVKFSGTCRRRD